MPSISLPIITISAFSTIGAGVGEGVEVGAGVLLLFGVEVDNLSPEFESVGGIWVFCPVCSSDDKEFVSLVGVRKKAVTPMMIIMAIAISQNVVFFTFVILFGMYI
jgi:hypothetical protein